MPSTAGAISASRVSWRERPLVIAQQGAQALEIVAPFLKARHRVCVVGGALQCQRGVQALGQGQIRCVHRALLILTSSVKRVPS
jgi:hypothetical protein